MKNVCLVLAIVCWCLAIAFGCWVSTTTGFNQSNYGNGLSQTGEQPTGAQAGAACGFAIAGLCLLAAVASQLTDEVTGRGRRVGKGGRLLRDEPILPGTEPEQKWSDV